MTPVRGQLLDNLRKKSREVWRPRTADSGGWPECALFEDGTTAPPLS